MSTIKSCSYHFHIIIFDFLDYSSVYWFKRVLYCLAHAPQDWDLEVLNCHPAYTPQDFAHMGVYICHVQTVYISLVQAHMGVHISLVQRNSISTMSNISSSWFLPWVLELYIKSLFNFHNLLSTMQYKKLNIASKCQRIRLFLMQNLFQKHDFAAYIQKIQYFVLENGDLILRLVILYHVYMFLYLNHFIQSLYILPTGREITCGNIIGGGPKTFSFEEL
jgi:hypothetical protein